MSTSAHVGYDSIKNFKGAHVNYNDFPGHMVPVLISWLNKYG